ncbi:binding-protein-dependent transport system inner membrane protein [Thermincola ferriacetica]|uniref:Binding-protein-dependent transport systems inner membrane component n=2 Tax=Thermincola TaxID=278993 RepID=D5X9X2_THEPJ|nr:MULTISPECIES: sugar ABC transporter permease [Thermincola]ADG83105.1 binding-protein-dependent transport systems inner membrane component [Thermincola potens JR]KNZ70592.1 binding-protein-dependent transport system inner membrane protein [Thermincola ferriacetica]
MEDRRTKWIMLLPALIVFAALGVYPTIEALYTSLTRYNLTDPAAGKVFIGLGNYLHLVKDVRFWMALARAVEFVAVSVSISFVLGLMIALILQKTKWFQGFFRIVFLVPMVIAPTISTLNFKFMYNYNLGIINKLLQAIGLDKIDFLGNPSLALWSAVAVDVWQWTPLVILVLLSGLEALPREPFEAALIDGASGWQVFRYMTLPLLNRFIVVVLIIRAMDALKVYETIQLMTAGGPGNASETLNTYLATVGFQWFDIGYASALGIFALYFTTFLAMILVKYTGAFKSKQVKA